jgi:mycofactocin system glycosyltransferase
MTTLRLDASCRRTADGKVLLGGSPLVLFRLTAAGAQVLDAIERAEALPAGHERLTDRLLDAGAVHPEPTEPGPAPAEVTVVVPALDVDPERLEALVQRCAGVAAVVVVDDASVPALTPVGGAQLVRLPRNAGPGAARNAGLARVTTSVVAFVDTDVVLGPGWLEPLLAHLADPRVALVAPRVTAAGGSGAIAAYESGRSPLDLGGEPARIRAGTRVSYVPAAVLVCRTSAVRAVGGFDATLRVGEDVDLEWRLDEAGWRLRYEPRVTVGHEPRPDLRGFARQRLAYGRSAAPLARRHPGALAPLRVSGWSAAVWALAAGGHPLAAGLTAAATTAALTRKLGEVPERHRLALRLAGLGHLHAGRQLASAMTRVGWPVALLAAVCSRRARQAVVAAALAPALWDWVRRRPPLDPLRYVVLRLLDDAAYGAGVWVEALRTRTSGPLVPDLTSWPGRPGQGRAAHVASRSDRSLQATHTSAGMMPQRIRRLKITQPKQNATAASSDAATTTIATSA